MNKKIILFRTVNGTEYVSNKFVDLAKQTGI